LQHAHATRLAVLHREFSSEFTALHLQEEAVHQQCEEKLAEACTTNEILERVLENVVSAGITKDVVAKCALDDNVISIHGCHVALREEMQEEYQAELHGKLCAKLQEEVRMEVFRDARNNTYNDFHKKLCCHLRHELQDQLRCEFRSEFPNELESSRVNRMSLGLHDKIWHK